MSIRTARLFSWVENAAHSGYGWTKSHFLELSPRP
jgi:hypothetical protein